VVSPSPANLRPSRRDELLELAYAYVLEHGLVSLSLRPLARAIGSSPRVLIMLFESKEGLVRALLARARVDELERLETMTRPGDDLSAVAAELWRWLSAEEHRALLALWVEAFGRSLVEPEGPWSGFARATVEDWLELLARSQAPRRRRGAAASAQRTLVLAALRGALLDLLATGDVERTGAAVGACLEGLGRSR
jgi:AcrR family transcriptional regulator